MNDFAPMKCPECGGDLEQGSHYREYICRSCGSTSIMAPGTKSPACEAAYDWLEAGRFEEAQAAFYDAVHEEPRDGDAWYGAVRAVTCDFDVDYLADLWARDMTSHVPLRILLPKLDLEDVDYHPLAYWILRGLQMEALYVGDDYSRVNGIYDYFTEVVRQAEPDCLGDDGTAYVRGTGTVRAEVADCILLLQGLTPEWLDQPIEGWSLE